MNKRCTTCGGGLTFWDQVRGRFDHPKCWERGLARLPPENHQPNPPLSNPTALLKLAQFFSRTDRGEKRYQQPS